MRYEEFENVMSPTRIDRYLVACNANTRKAMTLYRLNLRMSQELFTVISCFEVTLRNAIDRHYTRQLGMDWLKDAVARGGMFNNVHCSRSSRVIGRALNGLGPDYTHSKLVAEMEFGFWRYLFARAQFLAGRQTLLQIFPEKPRSSPWVQYNNIFVFNELAEINQLRNRIAHHEPICFLPGFSINDSNYSRWHYSLMRQYFQWMQVDEKSLLYGLDHIYNITRQVDSL